MPGNLTTGPATAGGTRSTGRPTPITGLLTGGGALVWCKG
jgi:hypothetical protein